jgi:thiol:disulfide interchange protein
LVVFGAGCPKPAATPATESAVTTPTPTASATPAAAPASETQWLKSLPEGLAAAKAENKPVLVDFFATWCGPCKQMDEQTWPDAGVKAAVTKVVPVRLDVDQNEDASAKFAVTGVPTVVILDATGKELDRIVGFAEPAEVLKLLDKHSQ